MPEPTQSILVAQARVPKKIESRTRLRGLTLFRLKSSGPCHAAEIKAAG